MVEFLQAMKVKDILIRPYTVKNKCLWVVLKQLDNSLSCSAARCWLFADGPLQLVAKVLNIQKLNTTILEIIYETF